MVDDKKNIPDAEKAGESPKPEKAEPVKADSPVHDQPAPAKAGAPVIEDASKEGVPPPGKDEKQTTIPGMGDPAPAGKVVDFTAARDGATKGKPRKRLWPRIRTSRRTKQRMRPSPAGVAHQG